MTATAYASSATARVRLITKGGYDWTKRFPRIAEATLRHRRLRLGQSYRDAASWQATIMDF